MSEALQAPEQLDINEIKERLKTIGKEFSVNDRGESARAEVRYYASGTDVWIGDGSFLLGVFGDGKDPDQAIRHLWQKLSELKPNQAVVVDYRAGNGPARELRYNAERKAFVPSFESAKVVMKF